MESHPPAPLKPTQADPRIRWGVRLVVLGMAVALTWIILSGIRQSRIAGNERAASAALKVIALAQANFRALDLDRNGAADFWTGELRELSKLIEKAKDGVEVVHLSPEERQILDALSRADPSLPNSIPYHGYWFVGLDKDELGEDYRQGARKSHNPSKFGFCAYPAEYGVSGTMTFLINNGNTTLRVDLKGKSRTSFPSDAELMTSNSRMD